MKSLYTIIAIFILLNITSCDQDEIPLEKELETNIIKPEDVVLNFKIDGSAISMGNAPSPTISRTAPVIEDIRSISVQAGESYSLIVSQRTSKIASGLYLQIQNSDLYYDIPDSVLVTGGRVSTKTNTHNDVSVEFTISKEMLPGTFVILCSLYDNQSEVSNVVEIPVEVLKN